MEQWRDIPDHDGYQASDLGRIRSLDRLVECRNGVVKPFKGRILAPQNQTSGYFGMVLGRGRPRLVHRLVMLAFVGPCPSGHEVAHNDGNRRNNALSNLRYATPKENAADKNRHGTVRVGNTGKTHCLRGHEFTPENTRVDRIGRRGCRSCERYRFLRKTGKIEA